MENSQETSRPQSMKDGASDSKWSEEGRKDKMDFAHSTLDKDDQGMPLSKQPSKSTKMQRKAAL